MSYIAKILQPGERVVHVGRLHWVMYLPSIVLLCIGLAVFMIPTTENRSPIYVISALLVERGSKRFPRLVQAVHNGNSRDRSPNNLQNWLHFSGDRRDEYASG